MFTIESSTHVVGLRGHQIIDFLINGLNDAEYQKWWPGTHLQFKTLRRCPGGVGNVVMMDEYVGKRRVRTTGVVTEIIPGRRVIWEPHGFAQLPASLVLDLKDDASGVEIVHTIRVGFQGFGRFLDPLFRLYFPRSLREAMDEHVKSEFPRLIAMIAPEKVAS